MSGTLCVSCLFNAAGDIAAEAVENSYLCCHNFQTTKNYRDSGDDTKSEICTVQ